MKSTIFYDKLIILYQSLIHIAYVAIAHVFTVFLLTLVLVVIPIVLSFRSCWFGMERECYTFLFTAWLGLPYWSVVLVVLLVNWGYWNE